MDTIKLHENRSIRLALDLAPMTKSLVVNFANELAAKLYAAQLKYGYMDGWANDDWEAECKKALLDHIVKGDPRDVAIYCAFMWQHGWKTSMRAEIVP